MGEGGVPGDGGMRGGRLRLGDGVRGVSKDSAAGRRMKGVLVRGVREGDGPMDRCS